METALNFAFLYLGDDSLDIESALDLILNEIEESDFVIHMNVTVVEGVS